MSALRDRFVLIVEDEPLVALDIADELSARGGHSVVARTVEEALSALERVKFAVAVIDRRLGRNDASEVISRLEKLRTPFLIHSGCDEAVACNAPVVRKPAASQHLVETLSDLVR